MDNCYSLNLTVIWNASPLHINDATSVDFPHESLLVSTAILSPELLAELVRLAWRVNRTILVSPSIPHTDYYVSTSTGDAPLLDDTGTVQSVSDGRSSWDYSRVSSTDK